MANCEICGQPMPEGEEMFRYHGYSGKCPAPEQPEWRDRPFKERGRIIAEHHAKVVIAEIEKDAALTTPLTTERPMHIISDASLKRHGYVYERDGTAEGFIGYPVESDFNVVWKHIDGPLLKTSTGKLHWLTWWERIQLYFKWTTLDRLNWKHR